MIYHQDGDVTLYCGDALNTLREFPGESVDCVVTSPPYWGLRDYGVEGQIGLEQSPDEWVAALVAVFRECRRVLADHGTCWVNIGDSYNANESGGMTGSTLTKGGQQTPHNRIGKPRAGLKPKDLIGQPWRLAFALQADGWYLRSEIIWAKPNPMPESVTDRPTKAHEQVFLLTKRARYWYDQEAVREPSNGTWNSRDGFGGEIKKSAGDPHLRYQGHGTFHPDVEQSGRNLRSVWTIATQPYPEAHFATYPEELVRRCLLAGCPEWVCRECGKPRERIVEATRTLDGKPCAAEAWPIDNGRRLGPEGVGHWRKATETETLGWTDCGHGAYRPGIVLDPFAGAGTTLRVARAHQRHAVGIELNPDYCELIVKRLRARATVNGKPVDVPAEQLALEDIA